MKLDIYKRAETDGKFSYLAVPEGKIIPDEAVSIEWEDAERGFNFDEHSNKLSAYAISDPLEQINAKGYAITSINDIGSASTNY